MTRTSRVFLTAAWQAADAAGEIIRANWQKPKAAGYKGIVDDLVTDPDRQCERTIVEILPRQFPDHSILVATRIFACPSPSNKTLKFCSV